MYYEPRNPKKQKSMLRSSLGSHRHAAQDPRWSRLGRPVRALRLQAAGRNFQPLLFLSSLLQQPGPKKFKLFRIDLIYNAKKFKVLPLAI